MNAAVVPGIAAPPRPRRWAFAVWIAALLAVVNAGLMVIGIRLFDRESILTRWK